MKLRPSTRHFLVSAAVAVAIMAFMLFRAFARLGVEGVDKGPMLIELALFALAAVIGIGVAWFRVLADREERRKRRPPLNLP